MENVNWKTFMLNYIMEVGRLNRRMQWEFLYVKQFIETAANNSGEALNTMKQSST